MKGKMDNKSFVYLVKAMGELGLTQTAASCIGLKNENFEKAGAQLSLVVSTLIDENKPDVDMSDIVGGICTAQALLNDTIEQFDNVGLMVDCDSFNGHFYNAIGALSKALDYMCCVNPDDDEAHAYIDQIDMSNRYDIIRFLLDTYGAEINETIRDIKSKW